MAVSFFRPEKSSTRNAGGREQQRAREREQVRELERQMREAEARIGQRRAAITDDEADEAIALLAERDREKLQRLARFESQKLGFYASDEGSAAFARCCRAVMKNLLARDLTLGDIEEPEPEYSCEDSFAMDEAA